MKQTAAKSKHHIYTLLGKVGNGNFGEAFLVQSNLDHGRYIMKKIRLQNRTKQSKQQILKEVKLMQDLNHCYVIKYLQSFVKDKEVCIVMEYAQKGDLQKYLQTRKLEGKILSEEHIIEWFIQLAIGLKYIHQKKIVHRDLKPDNIFITCNNELKIGDFGISKLMNQTFDMAKTKIGTPFIMAPQIWQNMKYNQKSDIWSLGCVLHKMMTFKYPFQAENSSALMVKILTQKMPPILTNYSSELKSLVYEMLDTEAQNRPSVHKILQKHFIKKCLCQTLQKTMNLYDDTPNVNNENLRKQTSVNNLMKKRSSSSLSSSILSTKNMNSEQYSKMVQYKQNYPMLLQENRHLKKQLESFKKEKDILEQKTNLLLQKLKASYFMKEEAIAQFEQHILNYLYP